MTPYAVAQRAKLKLAETFGLREKVAAARTPAVRAQVLKDFAGIQREAVLGKFLKPTASVKFPKSKRRGFNASQRARAVVLLGKLAKASAGPSAVVHAAGAIAPGPMTRADVNKTFRAKIEAQTALVAAQGQRGLVDPEAIGKISALDREWSRALAEVRK